MCDFSCIMYISMTFVTHWFLIISHPFPKSIAIFVPPLSDYFLLCLLNSKNSHLRSLLDAFPTSAWSIRHESLLFRPSWTSHVNNWARLKTTSSPDLKGAHPQSGMARTCQSPVKWWPDAMPALSLFAACHCTEQNESASQALSRNAPADECSGITSGMSEVHETLN